jgi:hypothetical protein
MKKFFAVVIISAIFLSCNTQEKHAIDVCQKAKIQFNTNNELANIALNIYGLSINATWLDLANMMAKNEPNKTYAWHAKKSADKGLYIVEFIDSDGWGQRWEVDIDQKIVKSINQDDYLTRKYGFSRFGGNSDFEISHIQISKLTLKRNNDYYSNSSSGVSYVMKASVVNRTDKSITNASIDGQLNLIFKDKTVSGVGNYESGFNSRISKDKPWEPNTTRMFYIETKGIEKVYLKYVPEYVIFNVSLKADDPVGFSFDKDIADMDIKDKWKAFMQVSDAAKSAKLSQ